MGKPSKLADLKLVNKYYPPNGITNYSYRSPKLDTTFQFEIPVGRSSVGSDASVPSMEDDQESIVFPDGDDKSFYHASGAELWDKFWEDPFWEVNAKEAKREADGNSQISRNESYPALIPSPDESLPKEQYFLECQQAVAGVVATDASFPCTWPLIVAEPPSSPRPVTPKVTYSLFPSQKTTPPAVLNLSPRKSSLHSRTPSLWSTPGNNESTVSLGSLGRSFRATKSRSDVSLSKVRSSWNLVPALPSPATSAFESSSRSTSSRRSSGQSINQKQRFPIRIPRTRSDTVMSCSSTISAPLPIIINTPIISDTPIPTRSKNQPPRPPRSPPRPAPGFGSRFSQPEAHRIPPPLLLHRCLTETELPPNESSQSRLSTTSSPHVYAQTNPSTPTMPEVPKPLPVPVSVFELDSDSEEEERSFARRIARSFTSQKRTRSASAAPRSRKGHEVAKQQLKTAQVETSGSPASGEDTEALAVGRGTQGHKQTKSDTSRAPRLRKQKSEVFGKVFRNRW